MASLINKPSSHRRRLRRGRMSVLPLRKTSRIASVLHSSKTTRDQLDDRSRQDKVGIRRSTR